MTTETALPPLAPSPQSEPITRAALDARIAAGGHELRLVRTVVDLDDDHRGGVRLPSYATYLACSVCGASVDEDAEGMDVDARLLVACQEPLWVSYSWDTGGDESEGEG